jgi:hypothetical protein
MQSANEGAGMLPEHSSGAHGADVAPYRVLVDDNFHYRDESERYTLGTFATCAEAMAACRRIVDEFLLDQYKPGMDAVDLCRLYTGFGEDPFIVSADPACRFSAWTYATARCAEICSR